MKSGLFGVTKISSIMINAIKNNYAKELKGKINEFKNKTANDGNIKDQRRKILRGV